MNQDAETLGSSGLVWDGGDVRSTGSASARLEVEHDKLRSGIARGRGNYVPGRVVLLHVVLCWRQQRITQLKSELQDAERRQSEEIAKIAGDEPVPALV